eukprot:TRINITY_DN13522_c0_g1_i1.p2 TRINITY_DN13522_c0_g1~~TRINITY_DN13522_c0_g1_i1.p2  ORF type:complete len:110 (-),score=23.37 TRINITY_DN13522_c0_g1_i1:366-695(-)
MDVDLLFGSFVSQSNDRQSEATKKTNNSVGNDKNVELSEGRNTLKEAPQVFGADLDRKVCYHEVCLPPGYTGKVEDVSLDSRVDPVRKYPFALDPFQKVSLWTIPHEFM